MQTTKDRKITFSIIGLGGRANVYLSALEKHFPGKFQIVAIADPDRQKQDKFRRRCNIPTELVFDSDTAFLMRNKLSDIAIVSTQDQLHFKEVKCLVEKGYDIILEKPIASSLEETIALYQVARLHPECRIAVCHVLRYTKFFQTIRTQIKSGRIGKIINIQHNENIGYYHFAHSYVRGPWRNTAKSSPLIVAKSCHDMDILLYLLDGLHARKISSFGSLSYFCHANFDESKMADSCLDCSIETSCPYSAKKIYSGDKIKSVLFDLSSVTRFEEDLRKSQYGKCVFNCDNDAVDHQVSIIEFENGVTATFNLSAFTSKVSRSIKIMGEKGEIRAIEKPYLIEVHDFLNDSIETLDLNIMQRGHGGGDENFIIEFMHQYGNGEDFSSSLINSIESHVMAFLAERSRLDNGQVKEIEAIMKEIYMKQD